VFIKEGYHASRPKKYHLDYFDTFGLKKEKANAQKQECGSPSLQPSLRCHTLAF
jgi:hypothetical protein